MGLVRRVGNYKGDGPTQPTHQTYQTYQTYQTHLPNYAYIPRIFVTVATRLMATM